MPFTDRVQVYKQEDDSRGGNTADDEFGGPSPINAQEDAIESAGLILQDSNNRDEKVYIDRDGNNLRFIDGNVTTPKTLLELSQIGIKKVEEDQSPRLGGSLNALDKDISNVKVMTNSSYNVISNPSASVNIDWSIGQRQILNMNQTHVLSFSNPIGPCTLTLLLKQNSSGSNLISWPSTVLAPDGKLKIDPNPNSFTLVALTYIPGFGYLAMSTRNFKPAVSELA